jgi:hypothetical protein
MLELLNEGIEIFLSSFLEIGNFVVMVMGTHIFLRFISNLFIYGLFNDAVSSSEYNVDLQSF